MKNTFVAGIHAVGKSYLCGRAAVSGWVHSSASALIKQQLGGANWTGAKLVDDPDRNQKALIYAVKRINAEGQRLLLDGHFVLRNARDEFVFLDSGVFADLNLEAVILIEAPASVIAERLESRDGVARDTADIGKFLGAEREQAEKVCAALNLKLAVLHLPTDAEFGLALGSR